MASRPALRTYDQLSGGRLIPALRSWREAGASYLDCTIRLRDEFGIATTPSTVRRWLLDLPEEVPTSPS